MTAMQKTLILVFSILGVLTGFILSEMRGNNGYMTLAMGFVIPLFALCLIPRDEAGTHLKIIFYPLVILMSVMATARASRASLEVMGDFTALVVVVVLTTLAISAVLYVGQPRVYVFRNLPIVGQLVIKT